MQHFAICARVGPPQQIGKLVKYDGERRTTFKGGDDLANYSLSCCALLVKPLANLDHWGILNVLCILLPQLAPVEVETNVVMPQTKAVLYHLSEEVRTAVVGLLCKPANWQPPLGLIARDGQLLDSLC